MNRQKLLIWLVVLMLLIFGADRIAQAQHLYYTLSWLDMVMHFLGGFWVALYFIYFLKNQSIFRKHLFITLLLVLIVGVTWEVFEYFRDTIAHEPIHMDDTMSDLFFDLVGGVVAIFYFRKNVNTLK